MLTVQAGLVPRIFAYLFDRIEQVQNKQVGLSHASCACMAQAGFVHVPSACTAQADLLTDMQHVMLEKLRWVAGRKFQVQQLP